MTDEYIMEVFDEQGKMVLRKSFDSAYAARNDQKDAEKVIGWKVVVYGILKD